MCNVKYHLMKSKVQLLVVGLSFLLLLGIVFSCQEEVLVYGDTSSMYKQEAYNELLYLSEIEESPQLSKEEAIDIARNLPNLNLHLRSNAQKQIERVDCIGNSLKTRSESNEVDTAFYIINFSDNEGYVILSGDLRVNTLLGFSDKGNIDWNNLSENSGISFFKETLVNTIDQERKEFNEKLDSLREICKIDKRNIRGLSNWKKPKRSGIIYSIKEKVAPLVPVEWDQIAPYNSCAPKLFNPATNKKQNAYIGCAPVAIAQIMAAHRYPKQINGKPVDWDILLSTPQMTQTDKELSPHELAVCQLLRSVADSAEVKWGLKATSTDVPNITRCLQRYGFSGAPNYKMVDDTIRFGRFFEELKNKRPILLGGSTDPKKGVERGHLWVCDGYVVVDVRRYSGNMCLAVRDVRSYYHCNWGWNGVNNGYFYWKRFDALNPMNEIGKYKEQKKSDRVYNHKIYYFSDIHP